MHAAAKDIKTPVIGITGTGGAGKSSLTDELIRRFRLDQRDRLRIAVISIDPTRRKSGGALLGDRIRMNAINPWAESVREASTCARSPRATRAATSRPARCSPTCWSPTKRAAGFDLVIVETAGIGQSDSEIVDRSSTSRST